MNYLLLGFLLIQSAFAVPANIEVWFISASKSADIQHLLKERPYVLRPMTAELACQEMGDYCFDPQFGLYKKDNLDADVPVEKATAEKTPAIPPASAVERNLIDCDPKNYFDIFCGKARKEVQANSKIDIWIDTSSSMREMDFSDKEGNCFRKSLIKRLDATCPFNQKMNVMMFDTSIKQAGSMDSLCNNQGQNDQKRVIDWIERSTAKKLIIITDIYEFSKEFADYVESKHGKFKGDKDPFTAAQLLEMVDSLSRSCQ